MVATRYWNHRIPGVAIYWVNISKISPTSHVGLCTAEKEELNLSTNSLKSLAAKCDI